MASKINLLTKYLVINKFILYTINVRQNKGVKTMKFILECQNMACREYGETVSKIIDKMYAIEDSI